jgi:tetratricopeptide (TPR) repeat protein
MNRSQLTREHSTMKLPGPLFAVALLAAACCCPNAWCNPTLEAAIEKAEESLYGGRFNAALEQYRNLLNTLLSAKTPEKDQLALMPEVDLALRRTAILGRQLGRSADVAPLFSTWARQLSELSPTVSALAAYQAGWAALGASGSTADADRQWSSLGFLGGWRIIGPFDNERGTGFLSAYAPEKGIDLDGTGEGKAREVRWRTLPRPTLAGYVNFDKMLRPRDEALAYAATFISADAERRLSLRIGSDESYRVWLNGKLLASEDIQRKFVFDQNAISLPLQKGWNCLLIKIGESEGSWGFAARITGPEGRPARGWREGLPENKTLASYKELSASQEPEGKAAPSPTGTLATLRDRVAKDAPRARDHYLLGVLLRLQGAHDSDRHPDSDALRLAIQTDKEKGRYHYELARSFQAESSIAAQRDDNNWRKAMLDSEAAGCATASIRLAEYYLETFSNMHRARVHLDRARKLNPDLLEGVLIQSRIEGKMGFPDAGRRAVKAARKIDSSSPVTLLARAAQLGGSGQLEEKIGILGELLNRNHIDPSVRNRLVAAHLQRGNHQAAIELLEKAALLDPYNTQALLRLARIESGRDNHSQAASLYLGALEIQPEEHALLTKLGRAYWETGRTERAFEAWDRALELQPNLPDLRKRIEFLRAEASPFEDEFLRDGAEIAASVHKEKYESKSGEAARILLELTAVEVNKDGTAREFSQTLIQVLNDRGIEMFDRFATAFAQGEQVLDFKLARVHHPDGTAEDAKLPRFSRRASATQVWRRGSVDLPPLSAGDILEVQYIKEDIQQSFFGDYFGRREIFRNALATSEKTFKLRVPADRQFFFHQRNMNTSPEIEPSEDRELKTYTWTAKNIPKTDSEPGMPWQKEIMPLLEISTFENWESFNKWYRNLIRKQFESSPELDKKVAELVSGKDTELEKIRALYNFVVTDIRYNAWEFGVHGFKPYNASKVFARRFGDCKDKATLLCVMLDKVDIKAHPVLIFANRSRGEEDLSLPMVNHFNHCITYLPPAGDRPELYLDGTASFHSVEELPSMDRGAQVLIVRDEGKLVQQIPWNRPEDLSVDEEWDIKLGKDGSAEISIALRARGDFAVYLRSNYEIAAQRQTLLEKNLGRTFAGAKVLSQRFSDLSNLDENVTMEIRFSAPRLANSSPEELTLSLTDDFFGSVRNLGILGALEKRETDVILGNPRSSRLRVNYQLPAGIKVKSTPEPRDIDSRFGRFQLAVDSSRKDALQLERLYVLKKNRVPLAQYNEFRQLSANVDQLSNEKIVLKK